MRRDGTAKFFFVQHKNSRGDWDDSALAHFLFDGLPYNDAKGELGDHYRKLMHPQSASSGLWQKYGLHGYTERADADAMIAAIRERRPDREFRLVFRVIEQTTVVVG